MLESNDSVKLIELVVQDITKRYLNTLKILKWKKIKIFSSGEEELSLL